MITQKAIAEKAGVSRQLVSHALHGRPNVSRETRHLIHAVAKELGYHPDSNWAARLLQAKSHAVRNPSDGDVTPEMLVAPPVYLIRYERAIQSENANTIYLDFFQGLSEAFSGWKRGLALACMFQGQPDVEVIRHIVETGRGSAIINQDLTDETTQYLIERQFPMVALNVNTAMPGVPSVVADHITGYANAWRAVARAGHRAISFVGYQSHLIDGSNFESRMRQCDRGAVVSGVGLRVERPVRIPDRDSEGCWNECIKAWGPPGPQSRWPTMVFTVNDTCATSFISSLQSHGVRVPQDVSVIGFDDTVLARYFNPAITTLSKPRFEMGKAAAALLSDLLAGREGSQKQVREYQVSLVHRDSFTKAPVQLPLRRKALNRGRLNEST